jgi:hypothetical protein
MLQVETFLLPQQQAEANAFLKTHAPHGPINFNRDMIVVFYEDGEHSVAAEISVKRRTLSSCVQLAGLRARALTPGRRAVSLSTSKTPAAAPGFSFGMREHLQRFHSHLTDACLSSHPWIEDFPECAGKAVL